MSWWKSYIRWRKKPSSIAEAETIKKRLSMAYLFCVWNTFAFLVYYTFKVKNPKAADDDRPSKYYARILKAKDAKVLRYEGFKLIEECKLDGTERAVENQTTEERERQDREREEQEKEKRENLTLLVEESVSL